MYRSRSFLTGPRLAIGASTAVLTVGAYYTLRPTPIYADASTSSVPVTKRRPGPLWVPPSRTQMLDHLRTSGIFLTRTEEGGPESGPVPQEHKGKQRSIHDIAEDEDVFDLLIVGGGATGAGTALDAASRGLKVACVERDDFASGTSSKSTKLVHGGVRYLQKAIFELDYGESILSIRISLILDPRRVVTDRNQNSTSSSARRSERGRFSSRLRRI